MSAAAGLSDPQKLTVGRALLDELARRHDAGQVHGAIGPTTVLVDEAGVVGLVSGPVDQAYASPEVLSGQPATAASDVYSAAALLAHLFRGAPTLPPSVADLDPGLAWLLGPALNVDPATRPASAGEMVTALDQLADQRHGPDWRAVAALAAVGGAGAVPVLVLATGGTASAAGAAAAAGGAAGAAGAAGGIGVTGGAAAVGGGGAGGAAGSAAGGAASVAGTGASGQVAAAGGVVAPQGGALGGVAAPGAGAPAAAGHASHAVGGVASKGVAVKVGAVAAVGTVAAAGIAAALILLGGGETTTVDLPGTSNIYLAGASEEVAAQVSDPGTTPVDVDVDGAGTVSFPSVDGELSACSSCEPESPDGGNLSFPSTAVAGFNGIAGVSHAERSLFVVGVFVGDDHPDQPADAVVDLSDADDDAEQEPGLGEPFFIGNGKAGGDGEVQEVVVPEGARTLYLGFADSYGFQGAPGAYGDNQGSVEVEVTVD